MLPASERNSEWKIHRKQQSLPAPRRVLARGRWRRFCSVVIAWLQTRETLPKQTRSRRLRILHWSMETSVTPSTAAKIVDTAVTRFGRIDALVNNAGIYFSKHFTDYTVDDLRSLISVNIEGFVFITQLVIKQMLAQKTGGSIVNITAAQVDHPIAGVNSAVPMITKGGIQAVTRSLAMEYAKQGIRVNAVAPGVVDTPMHKVARRIFSRRCNRWGRFPR